MIGAADPLDPGRKSKFIMHPPSRTVLLLATLIYCPVLLAATDPAASIGATNTGAGSVGLEHKPSAPVSDETGTQLKPDPAVEKFWQALKLLRSTKPADLTAGRAALQASSDLEFTHAQVLLANCLVAGSYGFPKDARKGAGLFRLAAERGNAFAKVSLGQCLFTGSGVHKDVAKAAEWLNAALVPGADYSRPVPPPDFFATDSTKANGDTGGVAGDMERDPIADSQATAHFLLGQISDEQKKTSEAQTHYVAAAFAGPGGRDGLYPAALQAALNYAFGNGTPRDLAKAQGMLDQSRKLAGRMGVSLIHNYVSLKIVDEFATADLEESVTKAGEAYETELQFKIASTFADKKSKEYNPTEALRWYELAAESGQVWAMLSLAFIYSHGDLGQPDLSKAFYWFEKAGGGDKPKNLLGAVNLAICYQYGLGTSVDTMKASLIYRKFRDQHIVGYLGLIGQAPNTVQTYEQSMKLVELWAKDKRDAQAMYFMGMRYRYAIDVPKNLEVAAGWLKAAAKGNNAAAYYEMGRLYEEYPSLLSGKITMAEAMSKATDCYKKGSELGNVEATVNYAMMLATGPGGKRNLALAETTYLECLRLDPSHARAHNNLGAFYEDRLRSALRAKDQIASNEYRSKMLQHYKASASLAFSYADRNLGYLFLNGRLVEQDFKLAYRYFENAAEEGIVGMHFELGQMHEFGRGVPQTYAEAAYHYRLAALESFDCNAMDKLVDFYAAGKGVKRDLDRAIYWMKILNEKDYDHLYTYPIRLGDLYIQNKNFDLAEEIFMKLSKIENREYRGIARHRLSIIYANDSSGAANPKHAQKYHDLAIRDGNLSALHESAMTMFVSGKKAEALAVLEKNASGGHTSSLYELGRIYFYGDGFPKDVHRGLKLLGEAAERGSEDAQVLLANMTLEGQTGAPTLETAIRLATEANGRGHPKAAELCEKLEERRKNTAVSEDTSKARSL